MAETLVERIQKAPGIWRSDGAPLIHPGPSENYEDLESASDASNPDCQEHRLEIVKQWLTDKQKAQLMIDRCPNCGNPVVIKGLVSTTDIRHHSFLAKKIARLKGMGP